MIAGVSKEDLAVATGSKYSVPVILDYQRLKSGLSVTYLFRTTGQVIGVSLGGAVLQAVLLDAMHEMIKVPDAEKIIESIR